MSGTSERLERLKRLQSNISQRVKEQQPKKTSNSSSNYGSNSMNNKKIVEYGRIRDLEEEVFSLRKDVLTLLEMIKLIFPDIMESFEDEEKETNIPKTKFEAEYLSFKRNKNHYHNLIKFLNPNEVMEELKPNFEENE